MSTNHGTAPQRLGVGFVGSGFNAGFHMQAFRAVRDGDVRGVWSPDPARRRPPPRGRAVSTSVKRNPMRRLATFRRPGIDALWITGPNHGVRTSRRSSMLLNAVAARCAVSPARNPWRAPSPKRKRIVELVRRAGLSHGYLENQLFAPQVQAGHALTWSRGASKSCGRISPVPPRSTAARTRRGSGAASCRAAVCSTT